MNNFLEEKTDKFLWNDIDLYSDFEGLKKYLIKNLHIDAGYNRSLSPDTVSKFNRWSLQKKEYIVGVYRTLPLKNRRVGEHHFHFKSQVFKKENCPLTARLYLADPNQGYVDLIFYTNYGNIISLQYTCESGGFCETRMREIKYFTINKILSSKMINIINKSISSGFNDVEHLGAAKYGEELYSFISDVVNM